MKLLTSLLFCLVSTVNLWSFETPHFSYPPCSSSISKEPVNHEKIATLYGPKPSFSEKPNAWILEKPKSSYELIKLLEKENWEAKENWVLTHNSLTIRKAQNHPIFNFSLAHKISTLSNIHTLIFEDFTFSASGPTNEGINNKLYGALSSNPFIETIVIRRCHKSGPGTDCLEYLPPNLKEIQFDEISDLCPILIKKTLAALHKCKNFETISFSSIHMDESVCQYIVKHLLSLPSLKKIKFIDCLIAHEHFKLILNALTEKNRINLLYIPTGNGYKMYPAVDGVFLDRKQKIGIKLKPRSKL